MIEITVKMLLDENSSDTKRALAALFIWFPCKFSSCYCPRVVQLKLNPQAEVKAKRKAKLLKQSWTEHPQPEPEKAEQKGGKTQNPLQQPLKKYKTEDVRAAMASKLADHRIDLVNKLKDMGAKNVSSLPRR